MKKIALFTSGGDAPGMNAAIRAVVRTGLHYGLEIIGIRHGYEGMINSEFHKIETGMVSGIIQHGGTILKTSRSERFMTDEGQKIAAKNLRGHHIDALIAIGGDGTFRGMNALKEQLDLPMIGIPATIDDDLFGTDYTIGYDTAVNTAVDAVDKIRDTADSHDRIFFIEVMGRDAGMIALKTGIGTGAEAILIPETVTDLNALVKLLEKGWARPKGSKIVIVAEGEEAGGAFDVARKVKEQIPGLDTRVTVLGHIQRGGNPSCMDRYRASFLGFESVKALLAGYDHDVVGLRGDGIAYTPFDKAVKYKGELSEDTLSMISILSS